MSTVFEEGMHAFPTFFVHTRLTVTENMADVKWNLVSVKCS